MKAIFAVVTSDEHVSEIMDRFLDAGVSGATVCKSMGMVSCLSTVPSFFSRLRHLTGEARVENYTIFLVAEDGIVETVLDIVDQVTGGLENDCAGVAFVLPVDQVRGLN